MKKKYSTVLVAATWVLAISTFLINVFQWYSAFRIVALVVNTICAIVCTISLIMQLKHYKIEERQKKDENNLVEDEVTLP